MLVTSNIRLVLFLSLFAWFCLVEKGILYGLVEAYNCIAFTNFQQTKINSFQNLSPAFILKILQILASIFTKHILRKQKSVTDFLLVISFGIFGSVNLWKQCQIVLKIYLHNLIWRGSDKFKTSRRSITPNKENPKFTCQ